MGGVKAAPGDVYFPHARGRYAAPVERKVLRIDRFRFRQVLQDQSRIARNEVRRQF